MLKAITIKDDEKFLRQISKPVDFRNDKELKQNIDDLIEYSLSNKNCYAMASVQLGIPKRILFVKSTKENDTTLNEEDKPFLMINPEIISQKGKTEFWEACVSGLTYLGLVERPYELIVKYQDENGKEKIEKFEGFASTVISHELDHLDGIFHMDRAKELILLPKDQRGDFRKKNTYKINSKTCKFKYKDVEYKTFYEKE